jgi:hypothetical protein
MGEMGFVAAGLDHLEGRAIQVLSGGASTATVITTHTVANGGFTLATGASRVHAGLKYIADVETLDIETSQGTRQGKRIKIPKVTVRFANSRNLLMGPKVSMMDLIRETAFTDDSTTIPFTGDIEVVLRPEWNTNGRLFFRQRQPLPMTILAVVPPFVAEDPIG